MRNQIDKTGIIVSITVTLIALGFVASIGSIQEGSIQPQGKALVEGATDEIKEIPETFEEVTSKTLNNADNFTGKIPKVIDEIINESDTAAEVITKSSDVVVDALPDIPVIIKQTDGELLELISIPSKTGVPGCEKTSICFIPAEAKMARGGEAIWTNNDNVAHTVTSGNPGHRPNSLFDSGLMKPGDTYSLVFDLAFEYDYFCLVHPWMEGKIVVK